MIKAAATAAVATATAASNIGYAQPAVPTERPLIFGSKLAHVKPEDSRQTQSTRHPPVYHRVAPPAGESTNKMMSRPKTPVDFTRNMEVIFDNNLLLKDDFYTTTNLKDVFNLEEVGIFETDENDATRRISASSSHFVSIFPWKKIPGRADFNPSAQLTAGKSIDVAKKIHATISFRMHDGGPNFNETLAIFARNFVPVPPLPSPHGGPPAATSQHGNQTWRYQQTIGPTEKTLTIGFNPAGELSDIVLEIKENQNQEDQK